VRRQLIAAIAVACVCAAAFAVPALGGGPSLPALAKKVALALKLARGADKRSKDALALAKRASGTSPGSANGAPGAAGNAGGSGTTGSAGPPGPSGAKKIDFRAPAGTAATKILDFGGLVLTASCDAGPNLNVKASSTVADSEFHLSGTTHTVNPTGTTVNPIYSESDHLGPTSAGVSIPGGNFQGTFTYSTPAGAVVTGTIGAEQGAFNGTTGCWFGGWALHDPA
jgi:hypothetical protein